MFSTAVAARDGSSLVCGVEGSSWMVGSDENSSRMLRLVAVLDLS